KKAAINGTLDHSGCHGWYNSFGNNNRPGNFVPRFVINNTTGAIAPVGAPRNNCRLPASLVYDPVGNPGGTRCGDPDLSAAGVGPAAACGGAGRPPTTTSTARAPRGGRSPGNSAASRSARAPWFPSPTPRGRLVPRREKPGAPPPPPPPRGAPTPADPAALPIA